MKLTPPPPTRRPAPKFYPLPPRAELRRIYSTERPGITAATFRRYGPLERFDHQRPAADGTPRADPERGISYFAEHLRGCLVEVFGDTNKVWMEHRYLCVSVTTAAVQLLDLRRGGGRAAGTEDALAKDGNRRISQAWSRYFYEHAEQYGEIDGIIYENAHNSDTAIALYERAASKLTFPEHDTVPLADLGASLYVAMQEALLEFDDEGN